MITTTATELSWLLACAKELQNNSTTLTAEDWSAIAEDLRALAEFSEAKANQDVYVYQVKQKL